MLRFGARTAGYSTRLGRDFARPATAPLRVGCGRDAEARVRAPSCVVPPRVAFRQIMCQGLYWRVVLFLVWFGSGVGV